MDSMKNVHKNGQYEEYKLHFLKFCGTIWK